MFDIVPWFDEVYIVETGRLFFCGGDVNTVLLSREGVSVAPFYYVGPAIQECAFRILGQIGVRLSPWIGLVVVWIGARTWFRKAYSLKWIDAELLALTLATAPLLFQSALLARVDTWSFAMAFLSLAVLGPAGSKRGVARLAGGAFFAVLAVFVWPSALMLAPVYSVVCFDWDCRREFLCFCLLAVAATVGIAIPILPGLRSSFEAFARHSGEAAPAMTSFQGVAIEFAREFARAPFLLSFAAVGFFTWIRRGRYMALLAFAFALLLGMITRLYAFRFLYLTPFFVLMCADAVIWLRRQSPCIASALLWTTVVYGVLTGPVGHLFLQYPTLPAGLKENLSETIGEGPQIVFSPDFATYYIGRELGWKQLGYSDPQKASDGELVRQTLSMADAAVVRDWDPYETTQQSFTPLGLFCKYVLAKARQESSVPVSHKSWAARFGSRFLTVWHRPIALDGFHEVGRFDMIRAFVRNPKEMPEDKSHE